MLYNNLAKIIFQILIIFIFSFFLLKLIIVVLYENLILTKKV
jgi:hypothetical protein